MTIIVREAKVADAGDMAAIQVAAWRSAYARIMPQELLRSLRADHCQEHWRNALQNPGIGSYIVAELDGAVRGFSVYGPARDADLQIPKCAEIVAINVTPEHWRTGVGSALLNHITGATAAEAFRSIHLWVAEQNQRARRFYENHGFSWEGKSKHDPAHGKIHEVRYVRRLG